MRKKIILGCVIALTALLMTGCHLKHEWEEATCTEPSVCTVGGETRGEPLGHTALAEATCTEPSVCGVCGEKVAESLGHTALAEATCTEPSVCGVCGEKVAEPLGHTALAEATCTNPSVCSTCGATLKKALGHAWTKATCVTPKTCSVCGVQEGGLGKHEVSVGATYWRPSVCGVCGAPVGELLVPAFEQLGISINAFPGGTYDYSTGSEAGNVTTGRAFFDRSSVVPHENGYSTVNGQITIKFADNEARRRGAQIGYVLSDYYLAGNFSSRKNNLSDGAIYYFSVDYDGTVYGDCYGTIQCSYEQPRITANIVGPELWWTIDYKFYIPTGYDGCVICLMDTTQNASTLNNTELRFRVE